RYELVRSHVSEVGRMTAAGLRRLVARLERDGRKRLGAFDGPIRVHRSLDMRYGEQIFEIQVPLDGVDLGSPGLMTEVAERFHKRHEELYAYSAPGQEVVIVNARVAVVGELPVLPAETAAASRRVTAGPARRRVWLGAIPAVMTLGWFLPSLFAAGHTEALGQKLPFVLRLTVWERAPFLVLALAAFVAAERTPALVLGVLLTMLLVVTGVGGVLMPAWMDIVGRAIPVTLRGRFFALSNLAAAGAGFAGSFLTAHVLATIRAPASFAVCFLGASACMALSYVALALVREPGATTTSAPVALVTYLRRIPPLLGRDANLRWFLVARAFAVLGSMGGGFYTVCALRAWEALAAGLLADAFGFATVFARAAAAGTVALALLVSLVRDPRGVRSGLTGRGLTGDTK